MAKNLITSNNMTYASNISDLKNKNNQTMEYDFIKPIKSISKMKRRVQKRSMKNGVMWSKEMQTKQQKEFLVRNDGRNVVQHKVAFSSSSQVQVFINDSKKNGNGSGSGR